MDQIREIINEPEISRFKISFFGFNKKEILEYINNLEQTSKNSVYNYERKLSEQANSLTMALREKDNLTAKVKELEEKVKYLSVDADEQKSSLVAENNSLKNKVAELSEYESKNEMLTAEITGLKSRCEFAEKERQGLLDTVKEKEDTIAEQCRRNAESERLLKNELEKFRISSDSDRKIQLLNIQNAKDGLSKVIGILEQL